MYIQSCYYELFICIYICGLATDEQRKELIHNTLYGTGTVETA